MTCALRKINLELNDGIYELATDISLYADWTANNYTITVNGKDKMCLLNGDISGSIPEPVEFHVQNYVDRTTGRIIEEIPTLKTIIYKAVSHYGGELF